MRWAYLWVLVLCAFAASAGATVPASSDQVQNTRDLRERLRRLYEEELQPETREAIVGFFLDKRHLSEVVARVPYNDLPLLIKYRDLKKHLAEHLPHERIVELGEAQDFHGWVPISELSEYKPRFDEESLALHLTTPADQRSSREIDLRKRKLVQAASAIPPSDVAAYVNFNNVYNLDDNGSSYRLDLDGALHVKKWVMEGRVDVVTSRQQAVDFYNLRVVRDFPEQAVRLTAGEAQTFRSRILMSDRIYGIKYARDFNLQPFAVTEPTSEFDFFLEYDSTVQVWVNGAEVTTLRLLAGPQSILNFPLEVGLNEVVLKITNELGQQETLIFNSVRGPNLLAPGLTEFAYSAGVRGQGSDFSDEWVVSAFYRRGLMETLTMSIESQGDQERGAIGIGANLATPWFYGSADAAGSFSGKGTGAAIRLTATRSFDYLSLTARFDYRSKGYLTNDQDSDSTRIKMLNELTLLVPNLWRRLSMRMSAHDSKRYHGDPVRRLEAVFDYRIGTNWHFNLNTRWSQYQRPQFDIRAAITYSSYSPKLSQNHMARGGNDSYSLRSSIGGSRSYWPADWNMVYSYLRPTEADDTHALRGSVNYTGNRFTSYYLGQLGDLGDANDLRQTLSFSTAVAYTAGSWALGRPIRDSFALVRVGDKLGKVDLRILSDGDDTYASHFMPALVGNLNAYYPETINAEAADLGLDIDHQHFFVLPHYRSGFLLSVDNRLGAGGSVAIKGTLLDHHERPVPLKLIIVQALAEPDGEGIRSFTNADGQFRVPGLLPDTAYKIVVWQSPADRIRYISLEYQASTPETVDGPQEFDVGLLVPTSEYRAPQLPILDEVKAEPKQTPVEEAPQVAEEVIEISLEQESSLDEPAKQSISVLPKHLKAVKPQGSTAALLRLVSPKQSASVPTLARSMRRAVVRKREEAVASVPAPQTRQCGLSHILMGPLACLRTHSNYTARIDIKQLAAPRSLSLLVEAVCRHTPAGRKQVELDSRWQTMYRYSHRRPLAIKSHGDRKLTPYHFKQRRYEHRLPIPIKGEMT